VCQLDFHNRIFVLFPFVLFYASHASHPSVCWFVIFGLFVLHGKRQKGEKKGQKKKLKSDTGRRENFVGSFVAERRRFDF
jgi:hypothetical protein